MISLSRTTRLISAMSSELTHTVTGQIVLPCLSRRERTFFANEGIVAVVGVIGIAGRCTAPISKGTEVKLCGLINTEPSKKQRALN